MQHVCHNGFDWREKSAKSDERSLALDISRYIHITLFRAMSLARCKFMQSLQISRFPSCLLRMPVASVVRLEPDTDSQVSLDIVLPGCVPI